MKTLDLQSAADYFENATHVEETKIIGHCHITLGRNDIGQSFVAVAPADLHEQVAIFEAP